MMACALYLPDMSLPALTEWMAAQGEPAFRARQVYRQFYQGLAEDFSQMTDLPVGLRERLSQTALLQPAAPAGRADLVRRPDAQGPL